MRLLNVKQVCYILGVARATLYRWVDNGNFPEPKKLSKTRSGRIAWSEGDVQAWIAARPQQASS